ncbi:hypothetical protein [Erythrobacter sp. CCH5-A1]|uniref:hypothetical protein n=1 Tax=Erythrobacter sp. CCH5-A1 TaxID=1768792 RepID=UPI0012E3EE8F|nr:hypothetical protein [Erythrobacter sp. CCH5-A1]
MLRTARLAKPIGATAIRPLHRPAQSVAPMRPILCRHSDDDVPKMVWMRNPERSGLEGREHRKSAAGPFAGRQRGMAVQDQNLIWVPT